LYSQRTEVVRVDDEDDHLSSLTSVASTNASDYMRREVGECEATRDMEKEVRRCGLTFASVDD